MPILGHIFIFLILNIYYCECDNLTLNISSQSSNGGSDNINKTTYNIDGLACRKYSPQPHNRIVRVVDGTHLIWSGGNAECTGAIVYPETGNGKLIHLFITSGTESGHEYYSREGDDWKKIGHIDYTSRLNEFEPVPETRDSAKPTGKRKRGSSLVPSLLSVFIIPALVFGHIY